MKLSDARKGVSAMTKFMSNMNKYLSVMKINQTYLSTLTGIDKNQLFHLLTGIQEENGTDMEKLSEALGKNPEFFLSDPFNIPNLSDFSSNRLVLYTGKLSKKQEKMATELMELMENVDEVLSAKSRLMESILCFK